MISTALNSIDSSKLSVLNDNFKRNNYIRIENFLNEEFLVKLSNELEQLAYQNAFYLDGASREASDEQLKNLDKTTKKQVFDSIYNEAANGAGFFYGRNKLNINGHDNSKCSQIFLKYLMERSMLETISRITSTPNLATVDGQATRYNAGTFLTRHNDNVSGETRQIAYVLSLSKKWHPDWGGLLQFFENDGTPELSLSPMYNSLVLFDVNKVHSVTCVAPFAPNNRYSITGWFRS